MNEEPNDPADKTDKGSVYTDSAIKIASVKNQNNKEELNHNKNVLPSDDNIPNNYSSEIKINKYIVLAVVVIIILLIIAYLLYHYNILGIRLFVRRTLGLSMPISNTNNTTNSALNTLISSNFAGISQLILSSKAANAEGLGSSSFESYSLFSTGDITTAIKNGSSPDGLTGMLVLLGELKTNETLSYYYHILSSSKKIYNITIGGISGIEAVENTTPPANTSLSESYGSFNLTGYRCNISGFNAFLQSKLNQTVKITNASIYSISNMTPKNSTVFNSSVASIKPNETFNVLFPEEKCNSSTYETDFTVGTNYSISKLKGFVAFVKFSPYLVKTNQSEVITVLAVNKSNLYEISALSDGNNYVNELNLGFNNFIKGVTIQDFNT